MKMMIRSVVYFLVISGAGVATVSAASAGPTGGHALPATSGVPMMISQPAEPFGGFRQPFADRARTDAAQSASRRSDVPGPSLAPADGSGALYLPRTLAPSWWSGPFAFGGSTMLACGANGDPSAFASPPVFGGSAPVTRPSIFAAQLADPSVLANCLTSPSPGAMNGTPLTLTPGQNKDALYGPAYHPSADSMQ